MTSAMVISIFFATLFVRAIPVGKPQLDFTTKLWRDDNRVRGAWYGNIEKPTRSFLESAEEEDSGSTTSYGSPLGLIVGTMAATCVVFVGLNRWLDWFGSKAGNERWEMLPMVEKTWDGDAEIDDDDKASSDENLIELSESEDLEDEDDIFYDALEYLE